MGDQAGKALWTRPSFWKSAVLIAPMAATALFLASGTHAQTSGSAPPPPNDATTVAPKPTPEAARHRGGPKGGGRDKIDTGRTAAPDTSTDPAAPTQTTTPVAPIDAPDAAEKKAKVKSNLHLAERTASGTEPTTPAQTGTPVAPIDAPDAARGKSVGAQVKVLDAEPKARVANPTPAADPVDQTTERRREGPKGDGGHGRTETPAPDTQPAGRGAKPKGAGGHGRTATTPLIIGALGAATVLALVVSGGNDRPASP